MKKRRKDILRKLQMIIKSKQKTKKYKKRNWNDYQTEDKLTDNISNNINKGKKFRFDDFEAI